MKKTTSIGGGIGVSAPHPKESHANEFHENNHPSHSKESKTLNKKVSFEIGGGG